MKRQILSVKPIPAMLVCVIFLLFYSGVQPLSDPNLNDGMSYSLDFDNPATFTVSCYWQIGNNSWKVRNQSCSLTTPQIQLPGDPATDPLLDVPINFCINRTGNLTASDIGLVEYNIEGGGWITLDELIGNDIPTSKTTFSYVVQSVNPGSKIQFRVTLTSTDNTRKIWLCGNSSGSGGGGSTRDFCVGSSFRGGTTQVWNASTLPIKLLQFTAQLKDNKVMLAWCTATELNNDYFKLERSQNGLDFEKVTTVKGAGNSNSQKNYSYLDENPEVGTAYYRLSQIDLDGTSTFFDVVAITITNKDNICKLTVNPNPCIGRCVFTLENCKDKLNQEVHFDVFDALGNVVDQTMPQQLQDGDVTYNFDVKNNLKPGVYIVRGTDNSQTMDKRIVISR